MKFSDDETEEKNSNITKRKRIKPKNPGNIYLKSLN